MPLIRANARQFARFDFDETVDESKMILMEAIGQYDQNKGTFGNFLKNKLRYYYLDKCKKPLVGSLDDTDETGEALIDGLIADVDVEVDILDKEKYQELYRAMDVLDDRDREIIRLKYWDDMTNKEIGESLGISGKTVANRASVAVGVLREVLDGKGIG